MLYLLVIKAIELTIITDTILDIVVLIATIKDITITNINTTLQVVAVQKRNHLFGVDLVNHLQKRIKAIVVLALIVHQDIAFSDIDQEGIEEQTENLMVIQN